jgi:hypothetical protein
MRHISHAREHDNQLVLMTMTVTESSEILTSCSNKSEPSVPEDVVCFEHSTHTLKHPKRKTVKDSSATLTPCSTKNVQPGPECGEYFAHKTHNRQLVCNKKPWQSRQRHLRAAAPRVRHPGQNMWHISRTTQHNRQLVSATVSMTKSSATLTSYSSKSAPSAPKYVPHFTARERAQSSVGPRENNHRISAWHTYAL